MDAQTLSSKEECALDMVHRSNDAAVMDAQIKHSVEECARGMGQIAIDKMNLLHLDQNLNPLLKLKPSAIIELLGLSSEDKVVASLER